MTVNPIDTQSGWLSIGASFDAAAVRVVRLTIAIQWIFGPVEARSTRFGFGHFADSLKINASEPLNRSVHGLFFLARETETRYERHFQSGGVSGTVVFAALSVGNTR